MGNDAMYYDYDLWLYNYGYIEDCDEAQIEYERWKYNNGYID